MALLMDELAIQKTVRRMSHEIIEKNEDLGEVILIGILSKGYPIAKMISDNILKYEGISVSVYALDISAHRDDEHKRDAKNDFFFVANKTCVIVDDVLYTGRTVRAAMDALMDMGRPKKIQLAVLIDRGHRELPIRPDYIGKNIPTSRDENVVVKFEGPNAGVMLEKKENRK